MTDRLKEEREKYCQLICVSCAQRAGYTPKNKAISMQETICDACETKQYVAPISDFDFIKIERGKYLS